LADSSRLYEIEHILPENPSTEAATEFGNGDLDELAQRLGNLVLVEKSINASLGNQAYSKKRPVYLQSQLLLTRSLAERPRVGTNTRIDVAVAGLESFDQWSATTIDRRQLLLAELAQRAWDIKGAVPPAKSGEADGTEGTEQKSA